MSQFDFGTIDPTIMDGTALAAALNSWRDALYTAHRGGARPAYAVAGLGWINDSVGPTAWAWNFYSGATKGDLPLCTIDTTGGSITMAAAVRGVTNANAADASAQLATDAFVQAAVAAAVASALGALFPVGTIIDLIGSITAAPAGWVLAKDGTIGSAASGASIRANADCANLYLHLWNGLSNADAPVTGGRGATASADWIANKPIGGLDLRGLARATFDAWGGAAAHRLDTFARLGQIGGEQTHLMTIAEMAAHAHGVTDPTHFHTITDHGGPLAVNIPAGTVTATGPTANLAPVTSTDGASTGISIQNTGGGSPHNNVQPTRTVSTLIKL